MTLRWQQPTIDTKFHIDMDWWQENKRDIRVYLKDMLCDLCKEEYASAKHSVEEIDWVDEQTGEVTRVDWLWHSLRSCCSTRPDYITPNTPIIDAVFRTFLANGNEPLSAQELYERIDRRPPETLVRILTAGPVYMGIRPLR